MTEKTDDYTAKLDGVSEYDARRPVVPTGTNLLGLVKHVASVEAGYLGDTFGRPFPEPLPWFEDDAEANADMWATAEESARFSSRSPASFTRAVTVFTWPLSPPGT